MIKLKRPFVLQKKIITDFLLIMFIGAFCAGNSFAIEVSNSIPEPNYFLTKNATDLVELTDGILHKFPAWTKKGSVGWKAASTILLELNLSLSENQTCDSGTLKVFSGKQETAGVKLPRRIDIYEGNHHIESVNIDNASYVNGQTHSISIPLKNISNTIALVIHTDGKFTMIDEITWSTDSHDCDRNIKLEENNFKAIIADSQQRLVNQLTARATPTPNPNKKLEVWFADPWGTLPTHSSESKESVVDDRLVLKGFSNKKEAFVVGIAGGCDQNHHYQVKLNSSPSIQEKIRIFEIKKQLVLDGSIVFDPLVPLENNQLNCSDSWNTYLWFSIDIDENTPSEKFTIEIQSEGKELKLVEVDLKIVNLSMSDDCNLNIVNWGYPQDQPIWNTQADLYQDLTSHGVNVFVIPPSLLKLPNSAKKIRNINQEEVIIQLKNIRKHNKNATILFFMAINRWFDNSQQLTEMQRENILTEWIIYLDQFLRSEGYTREQWMLYPVDEPAAKKLEQLLWTIDLIKRVSPEIRIYANPITLHKNPITYGQLKRLENKVDILQPSFELVQDQMLFFQNLSKPWWFYDNPPYPAKKAEPYFYRSLALKAWGLGANGTGFWSYSNTSKSSAWDDFDGKIADWAVVYEGKENIVTSRRWEAFAVGVEDYKFLCASDHLNLSKVQQNNDRFNAKLKKNLDNPRALIDLLIENKNYIHDSIQ